MAVEGRGRIRVGMRREIRLQPRNLNPVLVKLNQLDRVGAAKFWRGKLDPNHHMSQRPSGRKRWCPNRGKNAQHIKLAIRRLVSRIRQKSEKNLHSSMLRGMGVPRPNLDKRRREHPLKQTPTHPAKISLSPPRRPCSTARSAKSHPRLMTHDTPAAHCRSQSRWSASNPVRH